jgi:prophage antirepressor-like protein
MQVEIFKFESEEEQMFNEIRTVDIDGEIWFVASDVTNILGYSNGRDAVNRHCKTKGVVKHDIPTQSGNQKATLINEPNVYRLTVKSKLESAEKFEEWLFEEVIPSIRKKGFYGRIDRSQAPNFYLRYKDNLHKIDRNYFSVISELFVTLNAELEKVGYEIPNRGETGKQIMPDISVGRMFSSYLKKTESEFNGSHKHYDHSFPDDRPDVEARMYPIEALPTFRRFVFDKWIPENAQKYFKERDPIALDYLPKLLGN